MGYAFCYARDTEISVSAPYIAAEYYLVVIFDLFRDYITSEFDRGS